MNRLWHFLSPLIFGLLIYGSIRLVTDSQSREVYWTRPLQQNAIELLFVVLIAYLLDRLLNIALDHFGKSNHNTSAHAILKEFGLLLLASIVVINPVVMLIHYLAKDPVSRADLVIANIIILLYMLLYYSFARGKRLLQDYIQQQTQIMALKNENLQVELKLLKAQYHPHFLFNALNSIYFQMDENVPAAKRTLEQFSELLRYQLYDQQQQVCLKQELRHLQNFINLQSMRSTNKLQLSVEFPPLQNDVKIYPLLLLPLVENAFKYIGGDYHISITARLENGHLFFIVCNGTDSPSRIQGGGLGLQVGSPGTELEFAL